MERFAEYDYRPWLGRAAEYAAQGQEDTIAGEPVLTMPFQQFLVFRAAGWN